VLRQNERNVEEKRLKDSKKVIKKLVFSQFSETFYQFFERRNLRKTNINKTIKLTN